MDGDKLIKAVYESAYSHRDNQLRSEMREAMRAILRDHGDHIAENTAELRTLALEQTDLVEPE